MTMTVTFQQNEDILIATVAGQFTTEDDERTDRQIAAKCNELSLRKLLIDFRLVDGTPTVHQSYEAGSQLEERGFRREIAVAILDREEFREQNEFYELVAQNRGFQVRHFYTREDALAWLRAG